VFDFTEAGRHTAVLSLDYPLSTRRFIRATFLGWMRADAVSNAWVTQYGETRTAWQTLATVTPSRIEKDDVTVLTFDFGTTRLPFSRIRLDSGTPRFYRICDIESSEIGKDWTFISTQAIYRLDGEESLALSYSGMPERFLRLSVRNGQDQRLSVRQVALDTVEQRLKFLPSATGRYVLYYGNPKAQAPSYDLAMILSRRAPEDTLLITAGSTQLNPEYHPDAPPAKPWSERHPEILYAILGLAVAGMVWYCVRFLRSVKRAA
jgi:hypothetical protein